jgi:hypothetical protein
MIVDTFLFNNEFDMLDIHLAITEHYVDRWIILEADRTLSGLSKPFHLSENFKKYEKKFGDRIEKISLNLLPNHPHPSYVETSMRQGFSPFLEKYDQHDIIIHGDLDEIIDPTKWNAIIELLNKENKPVSCSFEMYMYKFDQKASRNWKGSVVAKRNMFETPHDLYKGHKEIIKRKHRGHCVSLPELVGWHWTWFGNDQLIKEKVNNLIEHHGRNPEEVLDAFKKVDTKSAINHKCDSEIIKPVYPEIVLETIKKYSGFWHNLIN